MRSIGPQGEPHGCGEYKPSVVTQGSETTHFSYGPNRELIKRIDARSAGTTTTLLIDNLYQQVLMPSGVTEHKFTVGNAIVTQRTAGGPQVYYLHKDQQGSTTAITNPEGNTVQQLLYDPWGKQSQVSPNALLYTSQATTYGYTGHDMVNDFEVIHMGGRTYNPVLGRFMQADPFIQQPSNLQSFNRYAYVLNNPMSYTDPSGYIFKALNKMLGKFAPLVSIGLTIWAPWGTKLWASIGTGFLAGGITTGSLRGALVGAFSAGAFHGVGTYFEQLQNATAGLAVAKVAAHGIVGGISSVLGGGKFGHGFASAGITQAFAGTIDEIGGKINGKASSAWSSTANRIKRIVAAAAVGGTASVVSGGKFGNGAITGAFSRGFNDEAHIQQENDSFWDNMWTIGDPLPQGVVDFSAGLGDVLSFGGTGYIRDYMGTNSAVNSDSQYYTAGELTGVVASTVLGGSIGWRAAGVAGKGLEFSHWIPNRMGGARSLWNGNFVSKEFHALSDPYRYRFMPRTWKALNPIPSRMSQQWDRIPFVYKGGAAGFGFGAVSSDGN